MQQPFQMSFCYCMHLFEHSLFSRSGMVSRASRKSWADARKPSSQGKQKLPRTIIKQVCLKPAISLKGWSLVREAAF